jgi:hypothetical protein
MEHCNYKDFSQEDAKFAAEALEIPPDLYAHLLEGMNVELEHCDFSQGDPIISARIALAHLREDPDYYEKLKKAGL